MGHGFVLRQPLLSQVAVKRLPPRIEDTASFGTRLVPAMTILVGAIVLLILLALYMPVFNLGKALNGSK